MQAGERQVAPDVTGIRRDHLARYFWAVTRLPHRATVLDLACGVGYGSRILAQAGCEVLGVDADPEAIDYAREHYSHPQVEYLCADADSADCLLRRFKAAVCFETIEHIQDPLPMLKAMREKCTRLLASVPNEDVFPYRGYAFHFRHYTPAQFEHLLNEAGWRVTRWWGQAGPQSEVERNCMGRTIIAEAEHFENSPDQKRAHLVSVPSSESSTPAPLLTASVPEHVAIVGMGPSFHEYVELAWRLGARCKLADEVWAINSLADVLQCDRVFHMDDVRIQEIRAAAEPQSNIANSLSWLKKHPGPIYTSQLHADYPGLVLYPIEDVVNHLKFGYFNNTVAWAVAFAVHIGVKKLSMYGCDYTYADAHHAEKGRGCTEFWLGQATARGISLRMPPSTSLMDAREPPERRYYGYDAVDMQRERDPATGLLKFSFTPKSVLPTAAEIEHRYDHSRHPNSMVEDSGN